ncbi:MAG: hypothetical protein Q9191_004632 [Dirinaria sp. TL-2023a]
MAIAAPASREHHEVAKHHSWHECLKVRITPRDNIGTKIPDLLPDFITSNLTCNASPKGKYSDSHCGNVFYVAREFCREHAVQNQIRLDTKEFKHEEYLKGSWETGLITYMMKDIDDYRISVQEVEHCYAERGDAAAQWATAMGAYDQCMGLLWGTWAQCDNKGRGGSVVMGCRNYTLTTLD